jgi:succinate dehydrogenase / fumarate reductase cytochrome b subunit
MSEISSQSPVIRASKWFDPRSRTISMIGFILNRITALGLTLYLFMHLTMLRQLSEGPQAYDSFLANIHNPIFTFGEVLVITAGFIHGLNGIRIVLNTFGIGVRHQKAFLVVVLAIAVIVSLVFALHMFSA